MDYILWTITGLALLASFIKDKQKSIKALKVAGKKFLSILPLFLLVMAVYALTVTFLPQEFIETGIGEESGLKGILISLGLGSVSVMPGFAAYPLGAAMNARGVPYYVIAGFVVSLMNVGIASFAFEKKFLGMKTALIRNIIALIISIAVVIIVKIIFNE